ncbi:GlcNAc-PI de-N-acetylase [Phlyctema vagabunda]|uniref:N-acetylglucosaminylphosphatidylinositol deacetylase n=1 Tax=Phlyctema vagabunda TaxID=108571 RepID=A0ABR4PJ37_9HELO
MEWLTLLAPPLAVLACWLYIVSVVTSRFPKLRNKRICLLIAHPDDEAMFFAPALLALNKPELGNHVKILCLSSGNADGLGETRKKELVKSGVLLGLRKEDDVFVVESPDFEDSMTKTWDAQKVSDLLSSAFAPNLANPQKSKSPTQPTATIDILITFDRTGISAHPNHISLYHGARKFISSLLHNRPGWGSPVDLYTLSGVSIARKYTSILDAIVSLGSAAVGKKSTGDHPSPLLFMSGPAEVRLGQQAMTNAHISQMRWFRWGWIGLSRYMVVNDLKLEAVS